MSNQAHDPRSQDPINSVVTFAIKTAIVIGAIVAGTIYLVSDLEERFAVAKMKVGHRVFWAKIEKEIDRLADPNSLPPEKREKIIRQIRAISANWAPFIHAVIDGANDAAPKR